MFGGMPSASSRPASAPIAVIVPIVSKKSASIRVKTSRTAATTPIAENEPNRLNSPRVPKFGLSKIESGSFGHVQAPAGRVLGAALAPTLPIASTMMARIVVATIEIRIAPLTLLDPQRDQQPAGRPRTPAPASPAGCRTGPSCTGTGCWPRRDPADEAGVDEADQRDEQADADGDRDLQLRRDGVEDGLPEAGQHEDQDHQALEDDQAHRVRPGHLGGDRERDERVQPEAGRQRQREVGHDPHQDRHHARHQRRTGGDQARLPGGDPPPRNFPSASLAKPRISGFSTMM